ncbi:MAG TPA: hypothetical protein VFD80_00995 [Flavobacteriaceae bacterium]|nr:hypothetical protein [Flavobacteriaceae bacterium]
MGIDKTELLLRRFDYKFKRENNEIVIHLPYSQRAMVDFSDPEKIKIKDKLVGWNFLTGLIEMSIKSAFLYNFICSMLFIFLAVYIDLEFDRMTLVYFYLAFMFWVLLWTMYYLVKAENLKQTLINWNQL